MPEKMKSIISWANYEPPERRDILSDSFKEEMLARKIAAVADSITEYLLEDEAEQLKNVFETGVLVCAYPCENLFQTGIATLSSKFFNDLINATKSGLEQAVLTTNDEPLYSSGDIQAYAGFDDEDPSIIKVKLEIISTS